MEAVLIVVEGSSVYYLFLFNDRSITNQALDCFKLFARQ